MKILQKLSVDNEAVQSILHEALSQMNLHDTSDEVFDYENAEVCPNKIPDY